MQVIYSRDFGDETYGIIIDPNTLTREQLIEAVSWGVVVLYRTGRYGVIDDLSIEADDYTIVEDTDLDPLDPLVAIASALGGGP